MTTKNNAFENAKHIDETGNEYWSARTLQIKQGGLQPTETTAKQQAEWWAETHPTASGNRPTSRHSGKETENNHGYAKQSEKID